MTILPEGLKKRLDEDEARFEALDRAVADPELFQDPDAARGKLKEHARLKPGVDAWRRHRTALARHAEAKALLEGGDDEMRELAQGELAEAEAVLEATAHELRELAATQDEDSESDVVVEINAGVGGDESALFAGDLFRMYSRYAERRGWKVDVVDQADGKAGGFKKVAFTIEGDGVFRRLRYESGGHRVQRVPETETQGRIHTSMATVVVLPQVEEVDVEIAKGDVRIDKYSAGGPGGQHVNKTQSAVRLTHEPTGIVVQCQDEKSQIKNLARAWKVLRARYADFLREQADKERGSQRQALRGRGMRNERVRTYNFPQDRCTDHRVGVSVHGLPSLLDGDLDRLLDQLVAIDKEEALKAL